MLRRWLLIAGMLGGIGAAAVGMVTGISGTDALPDGAVARVNDRLITRDAWLRAVAAVASERRTPLTVEDKRHILDRLIDEELLVQHGVSLGLIAQDRRLRGQLVSDVMATATATTTDEIDEAAMRRFYAAHQDFFTSPSRLRVSAFRISAEGVRGEFMPPVPDALLPPGELRTYLGPTLTAAALKLRAGESSDPIPSADGYAVLQVVASELSTPPPFEEVRDQVRQEMRRRADEAAVRKLLIELRKGGDVATRKDLE